MKHESILSMGVFVLGAAVFLMESMLLAEGNALAGIGVDSFQADRSPAQTQEKADLAQYLKSL